MNIFRYIGRSLVRYRRNHLTEAFGIALATAITVGALGVGDSAKRSLERMARARLGLAEFAASNGGKPFSAKIADSIAVNTGTHCSALLSLPAFLSTPDGKFTLSSKINGIDSSFAELAPDNSAAERLQERQVRRSDHTENEAEDNIGISPPPPRGNNTLPPILKDNNAFVGKSVADHMQLHVGDLFTAAVPRTGFLPAELAFAGGDSAGKIVLSLKLAGILPDREFPADFALSASGDPVFNVFVSRTWLSAKLADVDSANIILAACGGSETDAEEKLNSALGNTWTFKDMGLGFRHATIPGNGHWRALVSKSIFIPRKTADAALSIPSAIGILTYFVNSIDVEKREPQNTVSIKRSCPYSFVAAVPPTLPGAECLKPGGIALNKWLADDLQAKIGDNITLTYFIPEDLRRLKTAKHSFTVVGIVAMNGIGGAPDLTPDYPGLTDADDCADWTPSLPINLNSVRKKDEAYWEKWRAAPKAFISLKDGREIWGSRFGDLTSVLFSASDSETAKSATSKSGKSIKPAIADIIKKKLTKHLNPADSAPKFADIAKLAKSGARNSVDFGPLFLGLSFFIIAAAMILSWSLFALGVESRGEEIAILAKIGFPPGRVSAILAAEHSVAAFCGTLLGIPLGVTYCYAIVAGLHSFWSGAVGASIITPYVSTSTMTIGGAANLAVGVAAAFITSKSGCRRFHNAILDSERPSLFFQQPSEWSNAIGVKRVWWLSAILALSGAATACKGLLDGTTPNAPSFFLASGALTLLASWCAAYAFMRRLAGAPASNTTIETDPTAHHHPAKNNNGTTASAKSASFLGLGFLGLALRNIARRPSVSLTSVALLSLGMFLTFAVALNRQGANVPASASGSGTGGYELFVKLAIPLNCDPNTLAGRSKLHLDEDLFRSVSFVPLRLKKGDEASCLNLNSVSHPNILAIPFAKFAERGAFSFAKAPLGSEKDTAEIWAELENSPLPSSAVADDRVIVWSLKKRLGDEIGSLDANGNPMKLTLAASLRPSIFQGYVLLDKLVFKKLFGDADGIRALLVDCPKKKIAKIATALEHSLRNNGVVVEKCSARLARFRRVENTYLSIFLALGGLGLAVGGAGFGVLAARGAVERKLELELLDALGFPKRRIEMLLTLEGAIIVLCGTAAGIISASIAAIPAILNSTTPIPWSETLAIIAVVDITAILCLKTAAALSTLRV